MIKLVIGALFVATTTLAQTTTKPKQGSATKGSSTTMTKAMAENAKAKGPLPQTSRKEKLESGDNAIPSYREEKDRGIHKGRNRYEPRRTKLGARKDTMKTIKL